MKIYEAKTSSIPLDILILLYCYKKSGSKQLIPTVFSGVFVSETNEIIVGSPVVSNSTEETFAEHLDTRWEVRYWSYLPDDLLELIDSEVNKN